MNGEVLIRKELDLSKPVYLHKLGAKDRILAGLRWRSRRSKRALKRIRMRERQENLKKRKKISKLRLDIEEQINEKLFKEEMQEVVLIIKSSYSDVFTDAIQESYFSAYNIKILRNNSLANKFIDLPFMIRISRKVI